MKKLKQYSFYLIIPVIFLIAFWISDNRSKKEASTVQCKFQEITPASVKKLGGNFDENIIKQMNDETPYCKDFCLKQLDYSKKYNDWFAEEDLIKTCDSLGIQLPIK